MQRKLLVKAIGNLVEVRNEPFEIVDIGGVAGLTSRLIFSLRFFTAKKPKYV
jgi:hypothetical protein